MSVLVTGAAGYVGAHMTLALLEAGEKVVALDDLSSGVRAAIAPDAIFIEGDVGDRTLVRQVVNAHEVDAVIHFAGAISVPESLRDPLRYYQANTANALALVQACVDAGAPHFIFSSTAAVYGKPERIPISETAPLNPISPYGASMAMTERIVSDASAAHGFSAATLRYFNVAGAHPEGRAGEIGKPNHLLKVAAQIAVGARKEKLQIFGDDYPTPDGTCIRDYVHVSDIVDAHMAALSYLRDGGVSTTLNCGYGRGYSVYEVVEAVERVCGFTLPVEVAPRRPGDPPQLIADDAAIRATFGWSPRFDDLDYIVRTAVDWEARLFAEAGAA